MAWFERKQPRLPSYVDVPLDGLRADSVWTAAIRGARLDIDQCELVMRVESATVWAGSDPGSPYRATPALLLGRGDTLAIAFPDARIVRVVTRSKLTARLHPQQSGEFHILFASSNKTLDVWKFDGFNAGTSDRVRFGQAVREFLNGRPAQSVAAQSPSMSVPSTPGSSAGPTNAQQAPPPPLTVGPSQSVSSPASPDRETIRQLIQRLATVCGEVMQLHSSCEERSEDVQKARRLAAQPSGRAFLGVAERKEKEFLALLHQLQEAIAEGRRVQDDLGFLAGVPGRNTVHLVQALPPDVFVGEEIAKIVVGGLFLQLDFGSSMDSFYDTTGRLAQAMSSTDLR